MPDEKLEHEALEALKEAFECCQSAGCNDDDIGRVVGLAFDVAHPDEPKEKMRAYNGDGEEIDNDTLPDGPLLAIHMDAQTASRLIDALEPNTRDEDELRGFRSVLISAQGAMAAHMAEHFVNGES